ncbi:MAG: hypothetical protein NVS3B3_15980 [Aquirhabdus sp.]
MIDHSAMKLVPQEEIAVVHHESDGMYTKEIHIPAGIAMGKEMHAYSHLSILGKGSIKLIRDDTEVELSAPQCLHIKAGVWHTVIAVTDTVWYCVHATNEEENK